MRVRHRGGMETKARVRAVVYVFVVAAAERPPSPLLITKWQTITIIKSQVCRYTENIQCDNRMNARV